MLIWSRPKDVFVEKQWLIKNLIKILISNISEVIFTKNLQVLTSLEVCYFILTYLLNPPIDMKMLMVCLGNICRSPLAEGIMLQKIKTHKLKWEVDSAGTSGWHEGNLPDRSYHSRRHC